MNACMNKDIYRMRYIKRLNSNEHNWGVGGLLSLVLCIFVLFCLSANLKIAK